MSNKNSSFQMGDQFNGYGKQIYLETSERQTHPPSSQKNIRLKPDFSNLLLKALGSMPVIIDPTKMDSGIYTKALGAMLSICQVIITKNLAGEYDFNYKLMSNSLTTGSYISDVQMISSEVSSLIGLKGRWEKGKEGWKYYQDSYLKNSWLKTDGQWYYLNAEGYMVTGWKTIDGKQYYFREDGHMVSGG